MPIQTRTEMLSTGIRSQLGIKVFGDDLARIERTAAAIERAVQDVSGTRSAFAERSTGRLLRRLHAEPARGGALRPERGRPERP